MITLLFLVFLGLAIILLVRKVHRQKTIIRQLRNKLTNCKASE
jgi:hypothetical protein